MFIKMRELFDPNTVRLNSFVMNQNLLLSGSPSAFLQQTW